MYMGYLCDIIFIPFEPLIVKNCKGVSMNVMRVNKPINAFVFRATAKGNNLDELTKDASKAGFVVETVNDTFVNILVDGRVYGLPLGYAVVFDSTVRLLSIEQFEQDYTTEDLSSVVSELTERVNALEKSASSKTDDGK